MRLVCQLSNSKWCTQPVQDFTILAGLQSVKPSSAACTLDAMVVTSSCRMLGPGDLLSSDPQLPYGVRRRGLRNSQVQWSVASDDMQTCSPFRYNSATLSSSMGLQCRAAMGGCTLQRRCVEPCHA